jgi:hypothetical protein
MCVLFIFLQPLVYLLGYLIYVCRHPDFQILEDDDEETQEMKNSDRTDKLCMAIPYMVLMQTRLLGSFEVSNAMIYEKFRKRDLFLVFNMENSYRIQIITETLLQSIP